MTRTFKVSLYHGNSNKQKTELIVTAGSMHAALKKFMIAKFPDDVTYYGRTESPGAMSFGTSASGQRIWVREVLE